VRPPAGNRLLATLPAKDRRRFVAACEPVELAASDELMEPGERIGRVYFPCDSFVSLIMPTEGHAGLEVGLVGDEGMLGVSLALGVDVASMRAVVLGEGPALRMDAAPFRRELRTSEALQRVLERYAHVLMVQLAQAVACTRFHVVEARLARWLLMTQDRAHADEFHATHEVLACMLGVRRVGITKAATSLQRRRLIRYHRGEVTILDRLGLQRASCGCYEADRTVYSRVMGSMRNP
jgi:CRP-like cAMP-binding protein